MRPLRICLVTPAPPGSTKGNRVTALRWAGLLTDLGHDVDVRESFAGQGADLLIALHAGRSHESIVDFHREQPASPIVVALTGTDVYGAIRSDRAMVESVTLARRLVVLQPLAIDRVQPDMQAKARVIYQSCVAPAGPSPPREDVFDVCQLAHLRGVKDPLMAAEALAGLPATSTIQLVHAGAAIDADLAARASSLDAEQPRYQWVGDVSRERALDLLARSRLLVLTSLAEGGANVVTEAIACGTPVVSTHIDGSVGLLGADYPGFVPPGDREVLTAILLRCEAEPAFLAELARRCAALQSMVEPAHEARSWEALLAELFTEPGTRGVN